MTTVYVSIGNTDGKLTHDEWAEFHGLVDELLVKGGRTTSVYGRWHSFPATPYVNACWAVEVPEVHMGSLREKLRELAGGFRQDSIAFAVAETEFLSPGREDQ